MKYLDFDYSEDSDGLGTFDAMASTPLVQIGLVRSEVVLILSWAHSTFPGQKAPLDDGGEWDYHLDGLQELTAVETFSFTETTGQLAVHLGSFGPPRHNLRLSLTGTSQFCEAFRRRFLSD